MSDPTPIGEDVRSLMPDAFVRLDRFSAVTPRIAMTPNFPVRIRTFSGDTVDVVDNYGARFLVPFADFV